MSTRDCELPWWAQDTEHPYIIYPATWCRNCVYGFRALLKPCSLFQTLGVFHGRVPKLRRGVLGTLMSQGLQSKHAGNPAVGHFLLKAREASTSKKCSNKCNSLSPPKLTEHMFENVFPKACKGLLQNQDGCVGSHSLHYRVEMATRVKEKAGRLQKPRCTKP